MAAEEGFTLKWELGLRRGGASARWFDPARLTTVCQCSKKFFPYCSRGRPVKLSSACEGCFIPPANLQSCRAISAHWRYTVKKESKRQFVKKAQKQTNIIAPPFFSNIHLLRCNRSSRVELQLLHIPSSLFLYFLLLEMEKRILLPSWGLDEDKCFFLWSSQFLTI